MHMPGPMATACGLPRPVLTQRWALGGDDTFRGPSGLAPLGDGRMLVVDECRHSVALFDADGALVRRVGREGAEPGAFRYPTHATADCAGGFWVTDRWNHRVQHLDAAGRVLAVSGAYGPGPGEFNEPWGITRLDDGRLIVSDRSNHRVQVLSSEGTFVATCGRGGYGRSYYEGTRFKRGEVFGRWSALSTRFVSPETLFRAQGYALGTLEYPQGIAACGDGRVLIADPGLGTIHCCAPDGGRIEAPAWPSGTRCVPTNVAGLGDGLFVAVGDWGRTACLLNASGDTVLFDVPGIEHLTACAAGPGGTLWCLDGWNHRLVCHRLDFEPPKGPNS